MRPLIIILLLLIISQSNAFSQSMIGVHAGLISGKFSGDAPQRFKYAGKVNLTFGVSFDLQLKEDVYLSFAPAYINGSSKLLYPKLNEDEEEVLEDSIQFDFQNIGLPILLKLISDNKQWQFTGGFEFLFPTKLVADNSAQEIDMINDINKVNLNMLFGIGYIIPLDRSKLVIDLTYSQGLTNIANNFDDEDSLLPRIRYTSFRFTVGWFLPVGKNRFEPTSN